MKKLLLVFIVNFVNAQQSYIDYFSPYHPIESPGWWYRRIIYHQI